MTPGGVAVAELVAGVRAGDRVALGRAITLVESERAGDRERARELLAKLAEYATEYATRAQRVGISGAPGAGKSTLIDALGLHLTGLGKRVGVLAIDPSSERTGGSILGDKTRMARLAADPRAFIRPSPARGQLGGVAARTREAMLVLEAAGFEVVFVETVGVGQSETAVSQLVDTFVLLALAGAGDELQGIKRGVMEAADVVLVTKADGENVAPATKAAAQLRQALRLFPRDDGWEPAALTVSAIAGTGLATAWEAIARHFAQLADSGRLASRRAEQRVRAFRGLLDHGLRNAALERLGPELAALEDAVRSGALPEDAAAVEAVRRALAERGPR